MLQSILTEANQAPLNQSMFFVDYIATKQIIAPALNTIVGGPSKLFETSGDMIKGAIQALVDRAIKSCDIRPDLDPLDLLRALVGASKAEARQFAGSKFLYRWRMWSCKLYSPYFIRRPESKARNDQ